MGYFKNILNTIRATKAGTYYMNDPDGYLANWFRGEDSYAGVAVDESIALEYSAHWACLKVLSETLAMLPLVLYTRKSQGRERATNHYQYNLLHLQPNPEMTAFDFKQMLAMHNLHYGDAYAEIIWNDAGEAIELWPLLTWKMTPERVNGVLRYRYHQDIGADIVFPAYKILHLPSLMMDGIKSLRPIELFKQSLGLGLASQEYGARFFANDSRPGGYIKYPKRLDEPGYKRLKTGWEKSHEGHANKHKVAIIEEGGEFVATEIPPENAQFLETRKFQILESARQYRVPPHLVGDLERATFSNIEHQSLEFVMYTMAPHFVRWEQRFTTSLLTPKEQKKYYYEFLVDALLRGDLKTRYEAYKMALENGWMNRDEVRERENMNPIPNGEIYFVPVNWAKDTDVIDKQKITEKNLAKQAELQAQNKPDPNMAEKDVNTSKEEIKSSFSALLSDVFEKIYKRDLAGIRQAITQSRNHTELEMNFKKHYDALEVDLQKRIAPVYESIAWLVPDIRGKIAGFIERYKRKSQGKLSIPVRQLRFEYPADAESEDVKAILMAWEAERENELKKELRRLFDGTDDE